MRAVASLIETSRLALLPLRVEDADDMARVLGDDRLHEFIGGQPLTAAALHDRYVKLVAGSPDPDVRWLNWSVRLRADDAPIGTVQATLATRDGRQTAHVAWVIGVEHQAQGVASEAARALVEWLRTNGADEVLANIHPDNRASARVAARAGLEPTAEYADGEQVWRVRLGG